MNLRKKAFGLIWHKTKQDIIILMKIRHMNYPLAILQSSNMSADSIKINITAKNTGKLPLNPTILVESLKGNSGDGCSYNMPTWCSVLDFDKINPGESKTGTTNVTFFSTKDYGYISSQKHLYEIGIQGDRIGWNLNSWSIDLKKSN